MKEAIRNTPIDHLIWLFGCTIVEYSVCTVTLIAQQPRQLPGISMYHGEVQRAEIFVEGEICQVVIDVEKIGVLIVLRWLFI